MQKQISFSVINFPEFLDVQSNRIHIVLTSNMAKNRRFLTLKLTSLHKLIVDNKDVKYSTSKLKLINR